MVHDFDEYSPRKRHQLEETSPGVYLMDSRVLVSEANEVLGLSDREVHTVGGPDDGQSATYTCSR